MDRRAEIRRLLQTTSAQMRRRAGRQLVIVKQLDELHGYFAEAIAGEIQANNRRGRRTKLILPVGPVGQYPILADLVNGQQISLKQCWFFMMDEHCDDHGRVLDEDHPLSFRHTFDSLFTRRVKRQLRAPARQVIFPDHRNVQTLDERIATAGGI